MFIYLGVFFFYCAASWATVLFQGSSYAHSWLWLWQNTKAPFFGLTGIWILIEITIIYALCEELGWRGFALPKLTQKIKLGCLRQQLVAFNLINS